MVPVALSNTHCPPLALVSVCSAAVAPLVVHVRLSASNETVGVTGVSVKLSADSTKPEDAAFLPVVVNRNLCDPAVGNVTFPKVVVGYVWVAEYWSSVPPICAPSTLRLRIPRLLFPFHFIASE